MTRKTGIALLGALFCIGPLLAGGCAHAPATARAAALVQGLAARPTDGELFVIKRGWHIDIGFAVQSLTPPLRAVRAQMPAANYLLFGFGDRRYLTARSQRLDALIAALRPGAALVLLTGLTQTPQVAFGAHAVRTLPLAPWQMQAVQQFVWQTLAHSRGVLQPVQSGPYADSTYLAAVPRYSGLHTCNSWAAQGLAAAGLPVHTRGVVFAWQLWGQLPRLQRSAVPLRAATPGS
jgi:hypothetical protein